MFQNLPFLIFGFNFAAVNPQNPMANHYDLIIKEIMDAVYMALSKKFIDNNFSKAEELSTDIQRTREKKTDFLRKITYSDPANNFILHTEAQSKDDSKMIFRMMEYHAMLVRKYKMRVVQLVFYFGKGKSKMKNSYHDGRNTFSFELISIQEFSYKTFLKSDKPEELMLVILADFEDKTKEEIAELIFSKAKVIINETKYLSKIINRFGASKKSVFRHCYKFYSLQKINRLHYNNLLALTNLL